MVNKEKQALLELREILLKMSYDVNKTLNENEILLSEQMIPKGPYYTPQGKLTDKPGKLINGSTPTNIQASLVYPEIKDGNYPNQASFSKMNMAFASRNIGNLLKSQPKPKSQPTDSIQTRFDDRVFQNDATYVSPQYSGAYEKLPELGPDLTYTGKQKPYGPKAIPQINRPGTRVQLDYYLPYASKRWKGGTSKDYKMLKDIVEQDYEEWNCKYGIDLEAWLCRNSDTIHKTLMYVSIALTVVALTAGTVLSGGAAAPALVTYASGLGLALDLVDASLYVYEGNPREAALTFALGAVDGYQLFKGVDDLAKLGASADDVKSLQKIMQSNPGATIDELNSAGKLTKGELAAAEALSSGRNASKIAGMANQNLVKLALRGAKEYALKSPSHFITTLISFVKSPLGKAIPALGNVLKLGLVLDGIQISYNYLYNVFTGSDEELKSMLMSILESFWEEAEPQVEQNMKVVLEQVGKIGPQFQIGQKDLFTDESIRKGLDSVKRERLSRENARVALSTIENKYKISQSDVDENVKSTGFKTQEEGDAFRKWFNKNFKANSELIDLDLTGPYDNNYIRKAYWIELSPERFVGDVYKEQQKNKTSSGSMN